MNCREFLAEFEERRNHLSEWATLHMKDCPDCQKTCGEQTRIWQMIDELKRVEAPKTFDFRVKARIADSKPSDFQPSFLPVLRYVLPIGVIVLFLGLIAFNTNYFSTNDGSQQIIANAPQQPIETETARVNSFSSNQVDVADTDVTTSVINSVNLPDEPNGSKQTEQFTVNNPSPKLRVKIPQKNVKEDEGVGSRVSAGTGPGVTLPRGINPDQKIQPSAGNNSAKPASDEQVLDFFGIEIVSENGRRKVQTVKQNSSAERSNVKVGDVIEAIDGEKLSAEPLRAKKLGFKRLTVLRGTERVEITLQK
jgi:hypothetical protein